MFMLRQNNLNNTREDGKEKQPYLKQLTLVKLYRIDCMLRICCMIVCEHFQQLNTELVCVSYTRATCHWTYNSGFRLAFSK